MLELKLFDSLDFLKENRLDQTEILLDISEPIMFSVTKFNEPYMCYVLQNRYFKTKNKKRAHVTELLLAKTTFENIIELLEAKTPIYSFFENAQEIHQLAQISNQIFKPLQLDSLEKIENRFPKKDLKLDHKLPNKANIEKSLQRIKSKHKQYSSINLSEESIVTIIEERPSNKNFHNVKYVEVEFIKVVLR